MSDILDFEVVEGLIISSPSSDFEVQAVLGSSSFGEVAQCRKVATDETVALKVPKDKDWIKEAKHEVAMLTLLKRLHCEKFNSVMWNNSFNFKGRFCLEFEKLDITLFEFMDRSPLKYLDLMEIHPMKQLATALEFLGSEGVAHMDLKLENIMMVGHVEKQLKVKVIYFGFATYKPAVCMSYTLRT